MLKPFVRLVLVVVSCVLVHTAFGQHQRSIAREWNEVLLEAIRNDFARPNVHARNLFHFSTVVYDAWAAYDTIAATYFLGNEINGFVVPFEGVSLPTTPEALQDAREEAISYAAYRLLQHRFENSPGASHSLYLMDSLMLDLGYDKNKTSWNYFSGDPAALGNYIAAYMINYGFQDGANEQNGYDYECYQPVNPPMDLSVPGNPDMIDPNRWQPLKFDTFIDQSGNLILGGTPKFLGPEWGEVHPFSLTDDDLEIFERDSCTYRVYNDIGAPPLLDTATGGGESYLYKWGFQLVAIWTGHMDPDDGVMIDISPGSIGNVPFDSLPVDPALYPSFYDLIDGGDIGSGHALNPHTGQPYPPQIVKRGDYARVLAEYWADGPESETPPGHWFTILNTVMDHPAFQSKFEGKGELLDPLEYEVKAYFCLGGAMHDVAISAWSIKGWYDYVRPISAFRYMGDLGQSSDTNLPNYHPAGLELIPGHIELIDSGDALAGANNVHVGKVKVRSWRGHPYIFDSSMDVAGVDWIRPRNWWPYQRPSFVTPPFAGFISGHSTYSRAAAEVMTLVTGDRFFPGGVGKFVAPQNNFLRFEKGPSQTITLEWATYYDASDQCSLSRIWGGIHPPADDIPGRLIGHDIGIRAFQKASGYFDANKQPPLSSEDLIEKYGNQWVVFPNPSPNGEFAVKANAAVSDLQVEVYSAVGELMFTQTFTQVEKDQELNLRLNAASAGIYLLRLKYEGQLVNRKIMVE